MRSASEIETTPAHGDETAVIIRALTAAKLRLEGTRPPDERWKLTHELLDEAFVACRAIDQCRRRILFR